MKMKDHLEIVQKCPKLKNDGCEKMKMKIQLEKFK